MADPAPRAEAPLIAPDGAATGTPEIASPTPAARRPNRRAGSVLTLLALAGAAVAGGGWLAGTASGAHWLLNQVPGLQADDVQGRLLGPSLQVSRLRWAGAAGHLTVTRLALSGLRWSALTEQPLDPAVHPHLQMDEATAEQVHWQSSAASSPAPTDPGPPPSDLSLPARLTVARLAAGQVQIDALPTLHAVQARLALNAPHDSAARSGGSGRPDGTTHAQRVHQLDLLQLHTDRFTLNGQAQLGTRGTLPLQVTLNARQTEGALPWQARAELHGPLTAPHLQASLQAQAGPGPMPTRLDLQAQLQPFARWPLGTLKLSSQALDLNQLASQAPKTRLDVEAELVTQGVQTEAQARVRLRNAQPGRWNDGLLPLRQLDTELRGALDAGAGQLAELHLDRLDAAFGPAAASAGQVRGQGHLLRPLGNDAELQLSLDLQDFRAAGLDHRLPAVRLGGPARLSWRGPWPAPGASSPWADAQATLSLDLQGRVPLQAGGDAPARLQLESRLTAARVELKRLQVEAAGSHFNLDGWLSPPPPGGRWQWQAHAALKDFDPRPWLPGDPSAPWRQGAHQLSLSLDSSASLPALLKNGAPDLRQARGQLTLALAPSQMAGVALDGTADWQGGADEHHAQGRLSVAGNRAEARFRLPHGAGRDEGAVRLEAQQLAALAPLMRTWPELASHWPSAGTLQAQALADGAAGVAGEDGRLRWHVQAQIRHWQTADFTLGSGDLDVRVGPDRQAPMQVTATLDNLTAGALRLHNGRLKLDGTAEQHQFQLDADTVQSPPRWFSHWMGADPDSGSRLHARAEGRWQDDAANNALGGGRWTGRLHEFRASARNGSGQPWVASQAVDLAVDLDPRGRPRAAALSAGQMSLPGTTLRWKPAEWRHRPAPALPRLHLQATLDPLAVAPLLARIQPEIGWRGDLQLDGELRLDVDTQVDADLVISRRSGDLSISEDAGRLALRQEALELSDLRIGLSVHDGNWSVTQGLAGRRLGRMGGVVALRTSPQALSPPRDAQLSGTWQADVENLAAWGAWVPPGWRLGGTLHSAAGLGGTLANPTFTGRIDGSALSVTQMLQGVQWRDGQLALRLDGARATLETLQFQAGDGQVQLSGQAVLGERPQAELQLQASRFQLLGRVDRRLVVSGQGDLKLDANQVRLGSQLQVDEGLFDFSRSDAPSLDSDVTVVDTPSAEDAETELAATSRPQAARTVRLSAQLDLGSKLRIRGRGLDARLRGTLQADNPGGKLAVKGTVRAEDGSYAAYGQKLEIERGLVHFNGPLEDPLLDIYAIRPNLDVNVGVQVSGTALNPRVRLASDTDMSDIDKLSWLMLGRATDGLGQADVALLQRAALALLAGEGDGPTDTLLKAVGLTDFSVRQATDASDVRTTVVSVGKQLSRRWYVGYERSVNAAAGTWQLIYRVAQRFTLRAQSGEDSALDLIWSWRWD